MTKPREFWLAKPDLDFDLNWRMIHAAEYPHKNTLIDALHVIEYSAFEALKKENGALSKHFVSKTEYDAITAELNKKEFELAESAIALNAAVAEINSREVEIKLANAEIEREKKATDQLAFVLLQVQEDRDELKLEVEMLKKSVYHERCQTQARINEIETMKFDHGEWKHTAYVEADEVVRLNKEADSLRNLAKKAIRAVDYLLSGYWAPNTPVFIESNDKKLAFDKADELLKEARALLEGSKDEHD